MNLNWILDFFGKWLLSHKGISGLNHLNLDICGSLKGNFKIRHKLSPQITLEAITFSMLIFFSFFYIFFISDSGYIDKI